MNMNVKFAAFAISFAFLPTLTSAQTERISVILHGSYAGTKFGVLAGDTLKVTVTVDTRQVNTEELRWEIRQAGPIAPRLTVGGSQANVLAGLEETRRAENAPPLYRGAIKPSRMHDEQSRMSIDFEVAAPKPGEYLLRISDTNGRKRSANEVRFTVFEPNESNEVIALRLLSEANAIWTRGGSDVFQQYRAKVEEIQKYRRDPGLLLNLADRSLLFLTIDESTRLYQAAVAVHEQALIERFGGLDRLPTNAAAEHQRFLRHATTLQRLANEYAEHFSEWILKPSDSSVGTEFILFDRKTGEVVKYVH
jgi:hypothetical protein